MPYGTDGVDLIGQLQTLCLSNPTYMLHARRDERDKHSSSGTPHIMDPHIVLYAHYWHDSKLDKSG